MRRKRGLQPRHNQLLARPVRFRHQVNIALVLGCHTLLTKNPRSRAPACRAIPSARCANSNFFYRSPEHPPHFILTPPQRSYTPPRRQEDRWRLRRHSEVRIQRSVRIPSHPNAKRNRFFHPALFRGAPVSQPSVLAQTENFTVFFSCGGQRNPLKSLQLPHRPRSAPRVQVDVKLHYLIRRRRSRILHISRDIHALTQHNHFLGEREIREAERRVAQPIPKRIERRARLIPIPLVLILRSLRRIVRVERRQLTHILAAT